MPAITTIDRKALSDTELLAQSLAEPSLFEELVHRYQRLFVRKAAEIIGSEDEAYDVVQETFVRIYIAAPKFKVRADASFKAWAYKILINQTYTAYKKKHRGQTVSFSDDPELAEMIPDQAALEEVEALTTREQILRLISKLPVLLRQAVTLHFIEGKAQKEVALIEGVSTGVIRTRIHRAKSELRKFNLEIINS